MTYVAQFLKHYPNPHHSETDGQQDEVLLFWKNVWFYIWRDTWSQRRNVACCLFYFFFKLYILWPSIQITECIIIHRENEDMQRSRQNMLEKTCCGAICMIWPEFLFKTNPIALVISALMLCNPFWGPAPANWTYYLSLAAVVGYCPFQFCSYLWILAEVDKLHR